MCTAAVRMTRFFMTDNRRILEGATSSVLMARIENGVKTLYTPEPNHGILPGTTQGAIFEAARRDGWELGYGPLYPQDLFESDGVWLASSVRLLAPGYAPERYSVSA